MTENHPTAGLMPDLNKTLNTSNTQSPSKTSSFYYWGIPTTFVILGIIFKYYVDQHRAALSLYFSETEAIVDILNEIEVCSHLGERHKHWLKHDIDSSSYTTDDIRAIIFNAIEQFLYCRDVIKSKNPQNFQNDTNSIIKKLDLGYRRLEALWNDLTPSIYLWLFIDVILVGIYIFLIYFFATIPLSPQQNRVEKEIISLSHSLPQKSVEQTQDDENNSKLIGPENSADKTTIENTGDKSEASIEQATSLNFEQLTNNDKEFYPNEASTVTVNFDLQPSFPVGTVQTLDQKKFDKLVDEVDNLKAQLQQKDVAINELISKFDNIEKQLNMTQSDTNELKNKAIMHEEKIISLGNRADELKVAQIHMQQEIKHGESFPSAARNKMEGSPKLSATVKYTKPPFLSKTDSQTEPDLQSDLNNIAAN